MRNSSRHHEFGTRPSGTPPQGSGQTGALALAVLAAVAFCSWYIFGRELPDEPGPPAIVETPPMLPPATTDTAGDLPGHAHYTAFVSKDQRNLVNAPPSAAQPLKP